MRRRRLTLHGTTPALLLLLGGCASSIMIHPEDSATLEKTKAIVYDAYVLIRVAIGGVRMAQGAKFPDPLLSIQIDLMEKARAANGAGRVCTMRDICACHVTYLLREMAGRRIPV